MLRGLIAAGVLGLASPGVAHADSIQGRWKLISAEDLRADGTVARYPWGRHPVGSIVVAGGSCYVQIMSSDVPSFTAPESADRGAGAPGEINAQMKASLLSSYIAYSGPCLIDEAAGSLVLKVEAAWRPDYVGTEQKRFFRFDNGRLIFGPAPNSIRASRRGGAAGNDGRGGAPGNDNEALTRRLTLERVQQ
jgi:hypothetical protein